MRCILIVKSLSTEVEPNLNPIKKLLDEGSVACGGWITLGEPALAEIFAKAGFPWVVVDLEHSCISMREALELVRVIDLAGSEPFVRCTSINRDQIKRILDAGARGLLIPNVKSASDLDAVASACFFEPHGTRGVGLGRAQGYGSAFHEYHQRLKTDLFIVAQIESREAIENLDQIFEHPILDAYFIGPYDLSCSLGIPGDFDNELYKDSIKKILAIGERLQVHGGMHIVEYSDFLEGLNNIPDNLKFLACSVDIRILDGVCRDLLAQVANKGSIA